jgi:AcrR family transcriptional regulator
MAEKVDRRIQRTKKALREAVLELVVEIGFENLTIEKITDHANLGRTTFYLHYADKNELLLDSLQAQINAIFAEIYSPENIAKWINEGEDPRKLVFIHAAENPRLYKLIFTDQISGTVFNQFRNHISSIFESIAQAIQDRDGLEPSLPNPVVTNYVSGALIGLISWWLENDLPYPPEEIYQMYHKLLVEGAVKTLGI